MNKHLGLLAANNPMKSKNSKRQKLFIAIAAGASIIASGETLDPKPDPIASENDDVVVLGGDGKVGIVDAKAGDDKITGGDLADFIRGNLGADNIDGGAGIDNIVVIGVTVNAGYTLSDIQNPNGTGIDLSVLLELDEVNNHAVSDISAGEVIDGGVDGARLFVYGNVDFSNATLKNITRIDVQSEITISAAQLKALIDSGNFEALIGDGTSEIVIINDGSVIELDFSGVDMQNVKQITVAANVSLLLDQNDLRGMVAIKGEGAINAVTSALDFSGITIASTIIVSGNVIDLTASAADVSFTTATSYVNASVFASAYDDMITASAADMANSHINGLDGDDTLTITGGLGTFAFSGGNQDIINIEKIVFGDGGNDISGLDGQVKTIIGGTGDDKFVAALGQNYNLGVGDDAVKISQDSLGDAGKQTIIDFGDGSDVLTLTSGGKIDLTGGAKGDGVAKVTGVEKIILSGESQLSYEESANLVVEVGDGNSSVKTTGAGIHDVSVDAVDLTSDIVTLIGNDNYAVTGVAGGDGVDALGQTGGTLTVTTAAATADITIKTSAAASSRTVNADLLSDGNKIILEGAGDVTVNLAVGDLMVSASGDVIVNVTGAGGTNEINLGAGADELNIASLTSADDVDGGDGADVLNVTGSTANDLDGVTNFETINLINQAGDIVLNASVSDTGETVTINQTGTVGNHNIDASAVTGTINIVGDAGNSTFRVGAGEHTVSAADGDDIIELTNKTVTTINLGAGADIIKWVDEIDGSGPNNDAGRAIINDFTSGVDKLQFDSSGINEYGLSGSGNPFDGDYYEGSIASIGINTAYLVFLDTTQSYVDFAAFETAFSAVSVTNGAAGILGFLNSTSGHFELYVDATLGGKYQISEDEFLASFTNVTEIGQVADAFTHADFTFIA